MCGQRAAGGGRRGLLGQWVVEAAQSGWWVCVWTGQGRTKAQASAQAGQLLRVWAHRRLYYDSHSGGHNEKYVKKVCTRSWPQ